MGCAKQASSARTAVTLTTGWMAPVKPVSPVHRPGTVFRLIATPVPWVRYASWDLVPPCVEFPANHKLNRKPNFCPLRLRRLWQRVQGHVLSC